MIQSIAIQVKYIALIIAHNGMKSVHFATTAPEIRKCFHTGRQRTAVLFLCSSPCYIAVIENKNTAPVTAREGKYGDINMLMMSIFLAVLAVIALIPVVIAAVHAYNDEESSVC